MSFFRKVWRFISSNVPWRPVKNASQDQISVEKLRAIAWKYAAFLGFALFALVVAIVAVRALYLWIDHQSLPKCDDLPAWNPTAECR